MRSIIEVANLTKVYKIHKRKLGIMNAIKDFFSRKYEFVTALQNITFNINEGEIVGYIGPNGAGKTTTLKILSGILYPTDGIVKIMGRIPQRREKAFLRRITFIMGQRGQLWWDIPAIDTFLLIKETYGISTSDFRNTLEELVEMFKIGELIYVPVRKLSLGERMKMEIIAGLLHNPKILFLDEPSIGLDFVSQDSIRNFLIEYNRKFKATILLTSHYMKDIESICDRIIILHKGKIIFDGNKAEIMNRVPKDKVVRITFKHYPLPKHGDLEYLLSGNGKEYKFKVPQNAIPKLIDRLSAYGDIDEVRVEEMDFEDAIKLIFKNEEIS